ncbi:MAG TPA: R3H domain-containing nucleic acid-binding protein [Patescibacteria group bacterium]|nr:R3H domain-containing nucleic acid-binding protein [Patescibacteria group bacterium]
MEKRVKDLKGITDELLTLMGTKATANVSYDETNKSYLVNIDGGDETGLLIGKKGETLLSLQTILGILLKNGSDEWERVTVNVGDYLEKEEDYLKNLADSAASRAKETGEPQSLYNLKPNQRRIIHMILSEDKEIVTESVGEGEERYLVVRIKK